MNMTNNQWFYFLRSTHDPRVTTGLCSEAPFISI
jgi:hypothetical protein